MPGTGADVAIASEMLGLEAWLGTEIATAGVGELAGGAILAGEAAAGMGAADALGWNGAVEGLAGLAEPAAAWAGPALDFGAYGSSVVDMMGGGAAGGSSWGFDGIGSAMKALTPLSSIGSGLYGMSQADQMRRMAALAAKRSDPWGQSGGRALADSQLQDLMRDPSQAMQNDPSFKARMQGVQRAMAGYGQNSGAMAVAGANASTDWFNQRLAQLGGLAGVGSPGAGEQLALTGESGANSLASQSLASIGYGVSRAGGPGQMFTPDQVARLRAAGVNV